MTRGRSGLISDELAVFKYAFTGWRGRPSVGPGETTLTGHRRNAYPATLGAIVMVLIVETTAAHFLLMLWIGQWAWIPTGLGIYSLIWLLGDFNAARLNPTRLSRSGLELRTGLRWRVDLDWSDVVQTHRAPPREDSVSMTMMGKPDLGFELREPTAVHGPCGVQRTVRFVGLGVDDPGEVARSIEALRPRSSPTAG